MTEPVKIKLIPHDGGPCPVDNGFCFIKLRSGDILYTHTRKLSLCFNWEYGNDSLDDYDIIAYCPIEIEEG